MFVFLVSLQQSQAQDSSANKDKSRQVAPKPERFGLTPFEVNSSFDGQPDPLHCFASTDGGPLDTSQQLPLVLYFQGSGATPIFYGKSPQIYCSLMFDGRDFKGCHYVVIGKPGVPFFGQEEDMRSEAYETRLSLEYRVDAAVTVLQELVKKPWVDRSKVVLVGHSEGADVAPWVAAKSPLPTHLAVLSPGALSQMTDLTLMKRKAMLRGELTAEECEREIAELNAAYKKIFAAPSATDQSWYGHTYLRWSTFFRPAMGAYVQLDVPIFAAVCRDDRNTPCESGEALQLEFTRLGKQNLTYQMWPVDHHFIQSDGTDRRQDVLAALNDWLTNSGSAK